MRGAGSQPRRVGAAGRGRRGAARPAAVAAGLTSEPDHGLGASLRAAPRQYRLTPPARLLRRRARPEPRPPGSRSLTLARARRTARSCASAFKLCTRCRARGLVTTRLTRRRPIRRGAFRPLVADPYSGGEGVGGCVGETASALPESCSWRRTYSRFSSCERRSHSASSRSRARRRRRRRAADSTIRPPRGAPVRPFTVAIVLGDLDAALDREFQDGAGHRADASGGRRRGPARRP